MDWILYMFGKRAGCLCTLGEMFMLTVWLLLFDPTKGGGCSQKS